MNILREVIFTEKICKYIKCEDVQKFVKICGINSAFNECVVYHNVFNITKDLFFKGAEKDI